MSDWKEYRLGDVISIAGGFAYKGNLIGQGDNYLLGMGCVSYNENFLDKGARPYEGDCPDRYSAKTGDIVLATRQQSDNLPILGMPAIIPSKYEGCRMIVGANLYKVEIKDNNFDNRYIYWLLKTPLYVNHIRSCQSGTTVRMITKANIEDFVFSAPSKIERKRIADIIWTLDDKIEVNKRINENLEQQAQALFKSWFVDFEPFKDQPFVESELGMIPQGWRVGTLGDICVTNKRTYKGDFVSEIEYIDTGCVTNNIIDTPQILNPAIDKIPSRARRAVTEGDIIYSSVRPNQRHYALLFNPSSNTVVSTGFVVITANWSGYRYYIYQYLIQDEIVNKLQAIAEQSVSTFPSLNASDLTNLKIVIPPNDVVGDFAALNCSFITQINKKQQESRRLAELRDTLLPRLMSGELKVSDI